MSPHPNEVNYGTINHSKEEKMKQRVKQFTLAAALLALGALAAPQAEAQTAPCTPISNQAELTYSVGGIDQTNGGLDPIKSGKTGSDTDPTTFYVGVKINLELTRNGETIIDVTPAAALTNGEKHAIFDLQNTGNSTQRYMFSFYEPAGGTITLTGTEYTDTINLSAFDAADKIRIYVESGLDTLVAGNDTILNLSGDDADTLYVNGTVGTYPILAAGGSKRIYLVYDPQALTADLGAIAKIYLVAETRWNDALATVLGITENGLLTPAEAALRAGPGCTGYVGTDNIDVVVFDNAGDADTGDLNRDGKKSAMHAFRVATAKISVVKDKVVYWDPINLLVAPKLIPDAVVTYTLRVINEGNAPAVVTVEDILTSTDVTFKTQFDGNTPVACVAGEGVVVHGDCKTNDDTDLDDAKWDDTTKTLTVENLAIPAAAGEPLVPVERLIKFQVTIN